MSGGAFDHIMDTLEGVREAADHAVRTGPVITREHAEQLARLLSLGAASIAGWAPLIRDHVPAPRSEADGGMDELFVRS
jgi:hypothetical protein